jgi:hypothetical protein
MIRLDDFPDGRKGHSTDRDALQRVLYTFRKHGVAFILGVSPLLLRPEDILWLDRSLKGTNGRIVMHGFDHYFSYPGPWENIAQTWATGGEFTGMRVEEFLGKYRQADALLRQASRYDPHLFIPPFNAYTQAVLDALHQTPVEHLYGMDVTHQQSGQNRLNHGRLKLHLSLNDRTYGRVDVVLHNWSRTETSPVALHWAFDAEQVDDWESKYAELARLEMSRA